MNAAQDRFRESSGLYVLGALAPDERAAFEGHLETCADCAAEVRSLRPIADALSCGPTPVDPPSALRARVLRAAANARTPAMVVGPIAAGTASAARERPLTAWVGWIAAAAAIVVAVGLSVRVTQTDARLKDTESRLAEAIDRLADSERRLQASASDTAAVRASLALLTAPDTVELHLAGQAPARTATARVFLSRSRGLLFAATDLPAIPQDRIYQLWYLTAGAPVSAGLIRPDADGNATATFDVPAGSPAPVGMAVSLEPDGGVPAPTGAIYLASQ